jgi:hypothetical protein
LRKPIRNRTSVIVLVFVVATRQPLLDRWEEEETNDGSRGGDDDDTTLGMKKKIIMDVLQNRTQPILLPREQHY